MSLDRSLGVISQRAEIEKKLIGLAKTTESLLDRLSEVVAIDALDEVGEELVLGLCTRLTVGIRDVRHKHKLGVAFKAYNSTEDQIEKEKLMEELAAVDDKNQKALAEFSTISRRTTWDGPPMEEGQDARVYEETADDYCLLKKILADLDGSKYFGDHAQEVKDLITECTARKWPVTRTRVEVLLRHKGLDQQKIRGVCNTLRTIQDDISNEERFRFDKPWSKAG